MWEWKITFNVLLISTLGGRFAKTDPQAQKGSSYLFFRHISLAHWHHVRTRKDRPLRLTSTPRSSQEYNSKVAHSLPPSICSSIPWGSSLTRGMGSYTYCNMQYIIIHVSLRTVVARLTGAYVEICHVSLPYILCMSSTFNVSSYILSDSCNNLFNLTLRI